MADSLLAQALARFVASEHANALYLQPFSVRVGDSPWAVAVTGPTLMAVRGKSSYALADCPEVVEVLTLPTEQPEEVLTADLREWCGPSEPLLQGGVIRGLVFDRARLSALLGPVPFSKLLLWTTTYRDIPVVVLEAPGKWRAALAGIDSDPEDGDPVWGAKTSEQQGFDLAMSLE